MGTGDQHPIGIKDRRNKNMRKPWRTSSRLLDVLCEEFALFLFGGVAYLLVELAFRGYTHWTMFFLGGFCFASIGWLNEKYPWEMPLVSQMVISSGIITSLELIFGILLNMIFKLHVWDYSMLPYNLFGQISLIFSVAWFFLALPAIIVDDLIRWIVFGEEKPTYTVFYTKLPENLSK